jgi:hypothetical protein
VVLGITLNASPARRGRGVWKMNGALLRESTFKEELKIHIVQWTHHQQQYGGRVEWWDRYVKKKIKRHFIQVGTDRKREFEANENLYYTCIYDVLQSAEDHRTTAELLNRVKAKLLLHNRRLRSITINVQRHAALNGERTSPFHLIKSKKRRASTMVATIVDEDDCMHTTTHGILRTFLTIMQRKYTDSAVDDECILLERVGGGNATPDQRDAWEEPITREEVRMAIHEGARNKAPGSNGINLEFFQEKWEELADIWVPLFQRK